MTDNIIQQRMAELGITPENDPGNICKPIIRKPSESQGRLRSQPTSLESQGQKGE